MQLISRPRLAALAAQKKRKETGDERYYAPIEHRNVPFSQRLQDILAKPFKILFSEPMLIAITIYQSVRPASPCSLCCALTGHTTSSFMGGAAVRLVFYCFILNPGRRCLYLLFDAYPIVFSEGHGL